MEGGNAESELPIEPGVTDPATEQKKPSEAELLIPVATIHSAGTVSQYPVICSS